MKRLIISDTHIGSQFCREQQLLDLLRTKEYDQLILNGDIIEFLKIPSFTKKAAQLLKSIDYTKEVIYIIGNHDRALDGFIGSEFLNIKFCDIYEFEEGGRKFRIEHGDQYENGVLHYRGLMKFISLFQDIFERYFNFNLGRWFTNFRLKKRKLQRVWDIVDQNSDVDVMIIGHMHIPEVLIWIDGDENLKTYVNTGDWVQHATYVEIDDGIVRLKNFLKE